MRFFQNYSACGLIVRGAKSLAVSAFLLTILSFPGFGQKPQKVEGQDKTRRANLVSTTVVINEVYGGAGCGTAGCSTYQNDFIELRNISAGLVNISGWSVQYASATGTTWQVTQIPSALLRPGDTFLIAESFGANGVNPLPTPNITGTIAMSATAGKVALVSTTTPLSGSCPFPNANIVDFIGYGATANCNDSGTNTPATNAPSPSTTTSDSRNASGTDTDVNSSDFTTGSPTPQPALQPTPAGVVLNGRVVTFADRGIGKAVVTLIDAEGNSQNSLTGSFGYFSFSDLRAGETYVVTIRSKRYQFNPSSFTVTLNEDLDGFEIRAEP